MKLLSWAFDSWNIYFALVGAQNWTNLLAKTHLVLVGILGPLFSWWFEIKFICFGNLRVLARPHSIKFRTSSSRRHNFLLHIWLKLWILGLSHDGHAILQQLVGLSHFIILLCLLVLVVHSSDNLLVLWILLNVTPGRNMHVHFVSQFHYWANLPLKVGGDCGVPLPYSHTALRHPWELVPLHLIFFGEADVLEATPVLKEPIFGHLVKILSSSLVCVNRFRFNLYSVANIWGLFSHTQIMLWLCEYGVAVHKVTINWISLTISHVTVHESLRAITIFDGWRNRCDLRSNEVWCATFLLHLGPLGLGGDVSCAEASRTSLLRNMSIASVAWANIDRLLSVWLYERSIAVKFFLLQWGNLLYRVFCWLVTSSSDSSPIGGSIVITLISRFSCGI